MDDHFTLRNLIVRPRGPSNMDLDVTTTLEDVPIDVLVSIVERIDDVRDIISLMATNTHTMRAVMNVRHLNAPLNGIDTFALNFLRSLSQLDTFTVSSEFYDSRHCHRCLESSVSSEILTIHADVGMGTTQTKICKMMVVQAGGRVMPKCPCYRSSVRQIDDKYPAYMDFFMPHRQQKVSRRGNGGRRMPSVCRSI